MSAQENSLNFGSWREAEPVAHRKGEDTGYLHFYLSIELGYGLVGILSQTWRKKGSCPYGIWEWASQEAGRTLGWRCLVLLRNSKEVRVPGTLWTRGRVADLQTYVIHIIQEPFKRRRNCDQDRFMIWPRFHNEWQNPELRSSSSDPKFYVFIKMRFPVYF